MKQKQLLTTLLVFILATAMLTIVNASRDDDDNPYDNSFLIDSSYWSVKKVSGTDFNVLIVDGLNQSEYLGDYYIPYFSAHHQALSALPVRRIDVQYLDPVNLTLNLGILKEYYGKQALVSKNCSENNMNETFEFIDLDTFYGNIQDITIEIFPIKYIDCENNLATYYQAINYTLIFEEEPNIIKSFDSQVTVLKGKNATLNVEVTNISSKNENAMLVFKSSVYDDERQFPIDKYNISIPVEYNPSSTMYLLQYVKDGRIIESYDVYVESVNFDFILSVTKEKVNILFDNEISDSLLANITIEVIDRNETLVFNKTESTTLDIGNSNFSTNYNFCKVCDLYVTVDTNEFSFVKGINLNMYDDFVLSKDNYNKKKSNSLLYVIVIVLVLALIILGYKLIIRKKYY